MPNQPALSRKQTRAERAVLGSWLASALGVAGVLVPKCPLCLAAYLCVFGVSAGTARSIAEHRAPLGIGLVAVAVFATALFVASRGRKGRRDAATTERVAGNSRGTCSCR